MRIRNRKVPLPLSLLSPVPLSDPHLYSRSPVMPVQDVGTYSPEPSPSSNHLTTPTSWPSSDLHQHRGLDNNNVGATRFEDVEQVQISSPAPIVHRVSATTSAAGASENNNGRLVFLSNNKDRVGRWCDGDKAIPLKKRRGFGFNNTSFAENSSTRITTDEDEDEDEDEDDDTTTTATTEMIIMKWNNINDDEEEKQAVKDDDGVVVVAPAPAAAAATTTVKKGNAKRGNTILEGSRCSRVNGRGWRCCQPTLVGYSLCEHHLGKGRLRSMSASAKSRSSKKKRNSITKFALGRDEESDHTVDVREKKLERMNSFGNKRVKLGVVKARSLSSLLGQTNAMNNNNNIVADNHATMQQHEKSNNLDYQ